MGKKESTLKNMVLSLVMVTLLSSSALGVVYTITQSAIEEAEQTKRTLAIQKVIASEFDNNPLAESFEVDVYNDKITVYPAKNEDKWVGLAVESFTTKGYSGFISIMVGFQPDGTIYNTRVLKHNETPGLGDKMLNDAFSQQFNNKHPEEISIAVKADGGDIDGITAATISSRAYCDAIEKAYIAFQKGGVKQ